MHEEAISQTTLSEGNLHHRVTRLRDELDAVQKALDSDPSNPILREEEACYLQAFNDAILEEERFLKQKAKVEWLRVGDSNSAYFHKMVKSRKAKNRMDGIMDLDGNIVNGEGVSDVFVNHYKQFLGQSGSAIPLDSTDLFKHKLSVDEAEFMIREISDQEIKEAMFAMGDDKSPGPDGFSAAFFKGAWEIVGSEVTLAIRDFFVSGKLLKELNHTAIVLIPKVASPARINDYRLISLCNVIYKCISKIIANRVKGSLRSLVSINQSAFVPGRRISDNILLTQELMHNYHLDRGTPRCAFKVDIQKAYDTVDWNFLKEILIGFGFHPRMVLWIMECVTSTSFSVSINGGLYGWFEGRRGLRQGDPISPYLFTLVSVNFNVKTQN